MLQSQLLLSFGFRHGMSQRDEAHDLLRDRLGVAEVEQVVQVHGAKVVRAEGDLLTLKGGVEADALVAAPNTRAGARAVGVRVADCVPVLLADRASGAVAAVHAGWRGIVAGVLPAAIGALGADPSLLLAWIGPAIGPCCFEVDRDVAARLTEASGEDPARTKGDKVFPDLGRSVRAQLAREGLLASQIDAAPQCTFCEARTFYSFRREPNLRDRHLAAIAVRPLAHVS